MTQSCLIIQKDFVYTFPRIKSLNFVVLLRLVIGAWLNSMLISEMQEGIRHFYLFPYLYSLVVQYLCKLYTVYVS